MHVEIHKKLVLSLSKSIYKQVQLQNLKMCRVQTVENQSKTSDIGITDDLKKKKNLKDLDIKKGKKKISFYF